MVYRKRLALILLAFCLFAMLSAETGLARPSLPLLDFGGSALSLQAFDFGVGTSSLPHAEIGMGTSSLPHAPQRILLASSSSSADLNEESGDVTPSLQSEPEPDSAESGLATPPLPIEAAPEPADSLQTPAVPDSIYSGEIHEAESFSAKEWFQDIDKDYIYDYMRTEKEQRLGKDFRLRRIALTSLYSGHGNYFGFDKDLPELRKGKMVLPAGMTSRHVHLGYLSRFHTIDDEEPGLSFITRVYKNPVSLSHLQGSIGEGDNKLMSFGINKGDLFGVRALSLMANYHLQNGEWLERDISSDALRLLLNYEFELGELRYEKVSHKKQLNKLELKTSYWRLTDVPQLENRFSYDHLELLLPYSRMEVFWAKDAISSKSSSLKRKSDLFAIALNGEGKYRYGKFSGRYEYRDLKRNYIAPYDESNPDFVNFFELHVDWDKYLYLDVTQRIYTGEDYMHNLLFNINKKLRRFTLGFENDMLNHDSCPSKSVSHPVNDEVLRAIEFIRDYTRRFYLDYDDDMLSTSVGIGRVEGKEYAYYGESHSNEVDISTMLMDAELSFARRFGNWEPMASLRWEYYFKFHYTNNRPSNYYPEYRFGLSAGLKWHLGHDNALALGTNLATFTGYHLRNADSYYIEPSSIMDIWLNLDISRNFELQLEAKNLLDTNYHGVMPLPMSIHAGLRWYFLN